MQNERQLSSRLRDTLKRATAANLISDDKVSWGADDLRTHIGTLSQIIESNTLPGMRVGVSFPNWAVQGVAILAILMTNRVPVILSYTDLDADLPAWLDRSQVALMITAPGLEERLEGRSPYIILSRTATVVQKNLNKSLGQWMEHLAPTTPEGTALMMFTSGSTGIPKGVFVPASGLLKTVDFLISYFGLNESTISPIVLPVCHSMALNTQFLPTFLAGGRCYFSNSRFEIHCLYRTILNQKGTFVSLIGDVLGICREEKRRKNLPSAEHVQHVQLAGGMITSTHLQAARELFPNARIHKGYGLTEAIRATMINDLDPQFVSSSVGQPLPFVKIEVRDENGAVLPPLQFGEVFIQGDNVMLGATGTNESRIDANGFLATGDLGFFNEAGQLCISGRKDSLFKINGHRISGIEIENMAKNTSALIKNAKCLAIEDERRGRMKIILLLEIPSDLQTQFKEDHLATVREQMWKKFQSLAHFPKEILILEHFPRTSNGKLALQKMKELSIKSKKTSLAGNNTSSLQFMKLQQSQETKSWSL